VARGTLENTIIGSNTKLDDHVHIAHNCELGMSCIVTACAELSGGVVLGGNNWIGPNASIIQKVNVEKDAFIGIGAVVTKTVSKGIKVMGLSAMPLKTLAVLKRLVKNES
jgi:UDP-3-O-[3-hydroxymyristoyl] glucosamine N-acyltransferase